MTGGRQGASQRRRQCIKTQKQPSVSQRHAVTNKTESSGCRLAQGSEREAGHTKTAPPFRTFMPKEHAPITRK